MASIRKHCPAVIQPTRDCVGASSWMSSETSYKIRWNKQLVSPAVLLLLVHNFSGHMKRKRQRNQQVAPPFCYSACSCSRLRAGCNIDLHLCFASWRAAYSSTESLVRRICARLASIHRSGEYFSPNTCSSFSLAAASCPGRMDCRASYSSTGSRPAVFDFDSAYSCSAVSSSTEYFCSCSSNFSRLDSSTAMSLRKVSARASSAYPDDVQFHVGGR